MKRFGQIITTTILILSLCLSLSACVFDNSITPEQTLKDEVLSLFSNVKFEKVEEEPGTEKGELTKTYHFKTNEISFVVENYLLEDEFWGNLENSYATSYYQEVYKLKQTEFEQIAAQHNVELYEYDYGDSEEMRKELKAQPGVLLMYSFGDMYDENVDFDFYVDEYQQLDTVKKFLEDYHDLFEDYLPKKMSTYLNAKLIIEISCNQDFKADTSYRPSRIYGDTDIQLNKDANVDDRIENLNEWTNYLYIDYVRQGLIKDNSVTVPENFHPSVIDKLYINQSEFTSEKYPIKFYYNIEDDTYYTTVCFGCKFSYNGGVEDYLQREIINKYNLDTKYTIKNLMHKTTYQLHEDKFEVYWVNWDKENEDLKFSKNGKVLDIKTYEDLGPHHSGASYNRLISIDDFAMLCGLAIDEIDIQNGAIYCSSMK